MPCQLKLDGSIAIFLHGVKAFSGYEKRIYIGGATLCVSKIRLSVYLSHALTVLDSGMA